MWFQFTSSWCWSLDTSSRRWWALSSLRKRWLQSTSAAVASQFSVVSLWSWETFVRDISAFSWWRSWRRSALFSARRCSISCVLVASFDVSSSKLVDARWRCSCNCSSLLLSTPSGPSTVHHSVLENTYFTFFSDFNKNVNFYVLRKWRIKKS